MINKIETELKLVAETIKVNLYDIVDYRGIKSFFLMYSAFNQEDRSYENNKFFSYCKVSDQFK